MSAVTFIFDWLSKLDPRIWQAGVAGLFLSIGWLVNGYQNRQEAKRLREEKLRDTHRAIFAEIATNLSNLYDMDLLDEICEETVERMQGDPDFIPFIPKERNDRLFETVKSEIHILPRVTIDPVVRYYTQIDTIAAFAEDMRGAGFRTLEVDRRIAMYRDYVEMQKSALHLGSVANALIKTYSDDGKLAAEAAADRLTNG